jgi:hypothetical protein
MAVDSARYKRSCKPKGEASASQQRNLPPGKHTGTRYCEVDTSNMASAPHTSLSPLHKRGTRARLAPESRRSVFSSLVPMRRLYGLRRGV